MINEVYGILKANRGIWLSVAEITACIGLNPKNKKEHAHVSSKVFRLFSTSTNIEKKKEDNQTFFKLLKEVKK